MYEYKIISERDTRLAGHFDLANLEAALNAHGAQGWRVVEGFLAASPWKSGKAELVMLLERQGTSPA